MTMIELRTAAEIEAERKAFKADRVGHNGTISGAPHPGRITYLAHGKGYVMARHPGCTPFAIPEALWLSFPLFERRRHGEQERPADK